MVGGMIALGRGRLVSLETRTSFACARQHVRILKCFVILEVGCSLTVMTTQMKAQDSSKGAYVLMFVQSSVCWFFPHTVRFFSLSWCGPTALNKLG